MGAKSLVCILHILTGTFAVRIATIIDKTVFILMVFNESQSTVGLSKNLLAFVLSATRSKTIETGRYSVNQAQTAAS